MKFLENCYRVLDSKILVPRPLDKFKVPILFKGKAAIDSKKQKTKLSDHFLNEALFHLEDKNDIEKLDLIYPVVSQLENDHGLLSLLLRSFLFQQLGNQGKVTELMDKIYQISPLLSFKNSTFKQENYKNVLSKIELMTQYLERLSLGERRSQMLKVILKRELRTEAFEVDFSLQELREVVKSPILGLRYPTVWFPYLYKRDSFNQAIDYFEKTLELNEVQKKIDSITWLTQIHLPRESSIREKFLNKIIQMQSSVESEDKILFFLLAENETIKNNLSTQNKFKPLFNEKREFFRELLKNGDYLYYSFYQLLKLGDEQEEYFFQVAQ